MIIHKVRHQQIWPFALLCSQAWLLIIVALKFLGLETGPRRGITTTSFCKGCDDCGLRAFFLEGRSADEGHSRAHPRHNRPSLKATVLLVPQFILGIHAGSAAKTGLTSMQPCTLPYCLDAPRACRGQFKTLPLQGSTLPYSIYGWWMWSTGCQETRVEVGRGARWRECQVCGKRSCHWNLLHSQEQQEIMLCLMSF